VIDERAIGDRYEKFAAALLKTETDSRDSHGKHGRSRAVEP